MADNTVVHLGENSPEQVALKLLTMVAHSEKKGLFGTTAGDLADRQYILDTYAECLSAVKGHR